MTSPTLRELLTADWRANPRDPKARLVLTSFRLAQAAQNSIRLPGPLAFVIVASYRVLTEWLLGIELRPKTKVGPGLTLYHGTGLVVHDHAVIGCNVVLRHGVTIGNARPGGGCPVIEDAVEIGAGAILVGPIRIGTGARVGAGAVVTTDVPSGATAVGNPARVISQPGDD